MRANTRYDGKGMVSVMTHGTEPRTHLHPELIREFEMYNNLYDHNWPYRCDVCDLPCSSERGIKIHKSRAHKEEKGQVFENRLADETVRVMKMEEQQKLRPVVRCENEELENVFKEKYLGTVCAADAEQHHDVKTRIQKAMVRCGKLRYVFNSDKISLRLKLRLYEAAVCSLLTYGCESWDLTGKVLRVINGPNSRMLSRITGKSIQAEARPATTSPNLTRRIRIRRHRWVGHILRAGPDRLTYKALQVQRDMGRPGNLLMDSPVHGSMEELRTMASNRSWWGSHAISIQ